MHGIIVLLSSQFDRRTAMRCVFKTDVYDFIGPTSPTDMHNFSCHKSQTFLAVGPMLQFRARGKLKRLTGKISIEVKLIRERYRSFGTGGLRSTAATVSARTCNST